ncbi:MAG: hypothetical protein KDB80_03180 [Planctomycetes bacterium]|nr:hypothetical protein [Planctomycetota bacterium]
MRRRETAKRLLEIDWLLPVYAPDLERKVERGRTTTATALEALPRSRAFAEITDPDDDRPLLVLRECTQCKGSDAALLSRKLDNELTVLMTRWFRCVKLPTDVLEQDHPFRKLFEDEHPPHLFLCDKFGRNVIALDGNQSQTLLWKQMRKVLEERYKKDADRALKEIRKLLNYYDLLDIRRDDYLSRLDDVLLKYGPKSSKVRSLQRKIDKLDKDRAEADARKDKLFDLGLIPTPPLEPVVDAK